MDKKEAVEYLKKKGYQAALEGNVPMVYLMDSKTRPDGIRELLAQAGYLASFGCKLGAALPGISGEENQVPSDRNKSVSDKKFSAETEDEEIRDEEIRNEESGEEESGEAPAPEHENASADVKKEDEGFLDEADDFDDLDDFDRASIFTESDDGQMSFF